MNTQIEKPFLHSNDDDNFIQFNDVFKIDEIQKMQDTFSNANGISSVITDISGKALTRSSNFSNLCSELIQKTELGISECKKTAKLLSETHSNVPVFNQCNKCGLWEAGVSILFGGKHIGNWIIGQIRHEIIDESQIQRYAEKIGVNPQEFSLALNETPILTIDRFKNIANMLSMFVNEITDKAYYNYKLSQQINESTQIQKQLQNTNDINSTILKTALDGFWLVDLNGNVIEVNDSYCKISGYSKDELLKMNITDIEVIESYSETKKHIQKVVEIGHDLFETKHRRKDGTEIDVEINVKYNEIDGGRIIVFIKDITERKNALKTIIKERDRIQYYLDNIETIIITLDKQGIISSINRKGCSILGFTEQELVGKNWFSICLPQPQGNEDVYPYFLQIISGDITNIEYFENEIVTKTGEIKHIVWHNSLLYDDKVRIIGILSSGEDITAIKKTGYSLQQQNRLIESIINQSPDILYIFDIVETKNIFSNDGISRILGYSIEEIQNFGSQLLQSIMHPDDWQKYLEEIVPKYAITNDNETIVHEYRMKDKTGNWHWIESTESIYLRQENNAPKQIFGTARDVTENVIIQKALLEAEWKFKALFEKGPIGVAYHVMINDESGKGIDYQFLDANESYIELTGVDPRGKTVLGAFPGIEKDPFDWIGTFDSVAKTGKTIRFESYLEANKRWYDCVGYQYKPDHFVAAFIEITKRKEAEQALIQSEEQLQVKEQRLSQALSATSDALWEWNYVTGKTFYTSRWYDMLGYEDQAFEMTFETFQNLCHPDDFPKTVENIQSIIEIQKSKGYEAEFRMKQKNGTWKWILGRGNVVKRDEFDKPLMLSGTNTDISDRKKIEEKVKENEAKFKKLIWDMQVGVLLQGPNAEIIMCNPIALELLGLSEDQLLGKTSYDPDWNVIHEDGTAFPGEMHPVPQAIATKKPVNNVVMGVFHPMIKEYVWLLVDAVPELTIEGTVKQVVCTFNDISERKKAEEALKINEQYLKETQQIAQLGTYTLDITTGIWTSSEILDEIFGIPSNYDKSIGGWVSIIHPDWQQTMNDYFINEVVGKKIPFNKQYKIVRINDKEERWLHGIGQLKCNDQGQPIMMLGTIRDITDSKHAEQKILLSESRLMRAERVAKIGNWNLNLNNKHMYSSEGARLIYGVENDEIDLHEIQRITLPECRPMLDKALNDLVQHNSPYNVEFKIKRISDGAILDINSIAEYDKEKNVVFGVIYDITDRKKTEQALADSRSKFLKIFDKAPVLIAITKIDDGTYLDVNSFALQYSGYNHEEIIGKKSTEIGWISKEGRELMIKQLQLNGKIDGLEMEFVKKDGTKIWGLVNGEIMNLDNHECLLTITTDITDRKLMELLIKTKSDEIESQNEEYLQLNEELTQTNEELYYAKEKAEESDRLKSAFLANMSHEIRTPMNGILGFTDLLKESQLTNETRQNYVSIIEKSGNRMLNIINDIISISKVEAGQMEVVIKETNVIEQLDYIYTFFKPEIEQKGIDIIYNKPENINEEIINTDREKIYAILTNLVKNAIKFTFNGHIEFGYKKANDYIQFYVKDTGTGIPPEQKEIIFERFRQGSESLTRNYEGAGLGLAISKAYVEILGGKIWVESEINKGSTFYFTIPTKLEKDNDEYQSYYVSVEEEKHSIKPLKILIAEDDEASEMLLTMTLETISKNIIIVNNGERVIEECKNNQDIDLILMDCKMPLIDGYEATRRIRQFNNEVIIIAQTAFAFTGERDLALQAGCNDFITKPFSRSALITMIKKYF